MRINGINCYAYGNKIQNNKQNLSKQTGITFSANINPARQLEKYSEQEVKDILNRHYIRFIKNEKNGLFIIDSYTLPRIKNTKRDFDENKLLRSIEGIRGCADFKWSGITDTGAVEWVGKNLYLEESNVQRIGIKRIGETVHLGRCSDLLTSTGALEKADMLFIEDTNIMEFPNLKEATYIFCNKEQKPLLSNVKTQMIFCS